MVNRKVYTSYISGGIKNECKVDGKLKVEEARECAGAGKPREGGSAKLSAEGT
jgi:hypothetical protein